MFELDADTEILVVSASQTELFIISKILKNAGFPKVTTMESGIAALNLCTTKHFELVFCDTNVKFISGWLFIKEFKTSSKIHNAATVLMGKGPCPVPANELKQYGQVEYLRAPYHIKDVMAVATAAVRSMGSNRIEVKYTAAKAALFIKATSLAIDLYGNLKTVTEGSARSCVGLAMAHEQDNNFVEAEKAVAEALDGDSGSGPAMMLRLRLALRNKNGEQAKSAVEGLLASQSEVPHYYLRAGEECLKHGAVGLAESVFRRGVSREFHCPSMPLGLAKAHYHKGEITQAIDLVGRATRRYGESLESLNLEGVCLRKLGRYNEAKGCYEKALAVSPMDAKVYFNLGLCATAIGNTEDAISYLKASIRIAPSYTRASAKLAEVLQAAAASSGEGRGAA